MRSKYAHLWKESTGWEFYWLLDAGTFEPVKQSVDNLISAKCVYIWKADEYWWSTKTKSRFVVWGYQQRLNVNFGNLFPPTVDVSSFRLSAELAFESNLDLCHLDIEQAFVQSDLKEDVYMRLPDVCGRLSGKIVRLNKSLYGLKQASRQWHAHVARCLTLGLLQCKADACVFHLMEEGSVTITI